MRLVLAARVSSLIALVAVSAAAAQSHHDVDRRGARAMGFDQRATAHHFSLFSDGGTIEVSVNDPADSTNRDAIRSHLPHIARMFASGDFAAPMLVHDTTSVPGTRVMAARRDTIRYDYAETPGGGRVNIVTADAEALAAVHAFLTFQITDHKTGDSTQVRQR